LKTLAVHKRSFSENPLFNKLAEITKNKDYHRDSVLFLRTGVFFSLFFPILQQKLCQKVNALFYKRKKSTTQQTLLKCENKR